MENKKVVNFYREDLNVTATFEDISEKPIEDAFNTKDTSRFELVGGRISFKMSQHDLFQAYNMHWYLPTEYFDSSTSKGDAVLNSVLLTDDIIADIEMGRTLMNDEEDFRALDAVYDRLGVTLVEDCGDYKVYAYRQENGDLNISILSDKHLETRLVVGEAYKNFRDAVMQRETL